MYLSVFTVPSDMGLDHWQLIHVAPGKSVTVISAGDNTEARAIFFFASPPLDYDHREIGQQQELLETAFAGIYRVQLPCGTAWGHDGGYPGGFKTFAYTSPNGSHQAVMIYNDFKMSIPPPAGPAPPPSSATSRRPPK